MNDGFPNPGWYVQPHTGPDVLHYWDGSVWTGHAQPRPGPEAATTVTAPAAPTVPVQPGAAPQPTEGAAPTPPVPYGTPIPSYGTAAPAYGAPTMPMPAAGGRREAASNQLSFTTFAVVAAYILLAVTTHVALLGIFPMLLSLRAVGRHERLAPAAVVAAAIALVVGFGALAR